MGKRWLLLVALALAVAAVVLLSRDETGGRADADRAAADDAPERVQVPEEEESQPEAPAPEKKEAPEDLNEMVRKAYESQPRLSGRVVDRDGRGVPGVRVAAIVGGRRGNVVVTDAEGRFEFQRRGRAGLAFAYYTGRRRSPYTALQVEDTGAGVELRFDGLAGRVVADDDSPVTRGVVLARRPGRDEIVANAPIDEEGAFAFHGLEPGSYRLSYKTNISGSEYETVAGGTAVESWRTDVVLRLAAGATIEGIVFDDTGAPVKGIWIRATFGETTLTGSYSDEQGHFEIEGLVPGRTYLLTSWKRGYVPERREAVAGERDVRFEMDPGLTSSGRLVDARDQPLGGRQITFRTASGIDLPAYATTDGEGRFEIAGLPDEPVRAILVIGTIRSCGTFQPGTTDVLLRPESE